MTDLKSIFGIIETFFGVILLLVSIAGFYFAVSFQAPILNFASLSAADANVVRTGVSSVITILKTILYSFNFLFLFSSVLLILDGILKIKDED